VDRKAKHANIFCTIAVKSASNDMKVRGLFEKSNVDVTKDRCLASAGMHPKLMACTKPTSMLDGPALKTMLVQKQTTGCVTISA
jgi:hypothetical protein